MQNDILDKVIVKPVYTTRMMVITSFFWRLLHGQLHDV
jgi:hypothetical protein